MTREIRVVQVGLAPYRRDERPADLLARWPMLTEIPASMQRTGVKVDVVHAAWTDEELSYNGVQCHFVSERWPRHLRLRSRRLPLPPTRLARVAQSLRPDVIHINGLVFPVQTRYLASKLHPVPVLAEQRARPLMDGWKRHLYKWGLARVAAVAFTTRAQAQYYYDIGVLPPVPLFEVLGGSTRFTPGDRSIARSRTGIHGDPCILWVGRLNANKDPLTVLEAFEKACAVLPDPQLWLCYEEAPLLSAVRQRIDDDPTLSARVHLVGFRHRVDLEEFYRAADLFVLGSHYEATGFAAIEALACGTPVLLTDIPSFRLVTGSGKVGALSPPGDSAAQAGAIVDWSRRDQATTRREARLHFERALSFDVLARQLRTVYATVRGSSGMRAP